MEEEHSKGIILPDITDELLNKVFSEEFLDELMDDMFVENEPTED